MAKHKPRPKSKAKPPACPSQPLAPPKRCWLCQKVVPQSEWRNHMDAHKEELGL